MENPENKFTVRMVEEYIFCPLVFYYKYVLGIKKPPSLWSNLGRQVEEELSRYVEEHYNVIGKQVFLESKKYSLAGIVDYIVKYRGTYTPLEIKYSRKLKPWWKYTLTTYALLVEETYYKPVKNAILIMPGPKTTIINITSNDRNYIIKTLENMKKTLEEQTTPKPTPSKSCINCDYKNICPYQTKTQ